MRAIKKIKNAPKHKVVVEKAVAQVFAFAHQLVKRRLQLIKQRLDVFGKPVAGSHAEAAAATKQVTNGKIFLEIFLL